MTNWRGDDKTVAKAIAFIRGKGAATPEHLVEWDAQHGKKLFQWDDAVAGAEYRLVQARWFFNRFRTKFQGMRVRAFIHIPENEELEIPEGGAYYPTETISNNSGMRAIVIKDLTGRLANAASELKMWRLSDAEREAVLLAVRAAME